MLENLGEDKHVEGVLIHCLDAGSTPAISTCFRKYRFEVVSKGQLLSFTTLFFTQKDPVIY